MIFFAMSTKLKKKKPGRKQKTCAFNNVRLCDHFLAIVFVINIVQVLVWHVPFEKKKSQTEFTLEACQ
jgi:hypothetical protein